MAVTYNLKSSNINIQMEGVNGLEVLQYIQLNTDKKLDFVLLDLDMPIMNGFEACRQIIDFYENSNMFKLEKTLKKQQPK
jgi:CheY-like chemotaxis protein